MQIKRYACLLVLPLMLLLGLTEAYGQQRLEFSADKISGRRIDGERVNYLIDNVVIKQQSTTIYADSALVQKSQNRAEAFGRIRVIEGDSINITGKRLVYDGNTGTAYLYKDVVYRDGGSTLFTDNLEFNKFTGISSYHSGGRMINNQNTLTSRRGVFDKPNSQASFFGKVVLKSPDATVYSDTLYYNTATGQARFVGYTKVVKNDGTITEAAEGLTYNTQSENAAVLKGFIENQDYFITGTRLRYDRKNQLYTAEGKVKMTAKDKQIIILGEEAFYDKKTGVTKVYGRPIMKRPVQNDTLYLSADTMMAIESELAANKRLLAWGGVKIFKEDLQGVADSLAYKTADSLLFFYRNPVLWNAENQLTGDTVSVQIKENKIDRLRLLQNGFVISKDSVLSRYNQVKGRLITAFFGEDQLEQIAVNGNGESIYFVVDEKTPNVAMGMNRITCSNMLISFGARKVQKIRFYQQPDAVFVPPHELQEPETRLSGFQWLAERRPTKAQVLDRTVTAPAAKTDKKEGTVGAGAAAEAKTPAPAKEKKPAVAPQNRPKPATRPLPQPQKRDGGKPGQTLKPVEQ